MDAIMRFWAVMVGQVMGVVIILVAGILPYTPYGRLENEETRRRIRTGLLVVVVAFICTLLVLVAVFLMAMPFKDKVTSEYVGKVIWWFILVDLVCLLFVVCQQGGLTRSAFLPVFFLIPTAYLAVVPEQNMSNVVILLSLICACCIISFCVALFVSNQNEARLPLLPVRITDFSMLYHQGYNLAYLIVCVISLIIPALQFAVRTGYITLPMTK